MNRLSQRLWLTGTDTGAGGLGTPFRCHDVTRKEVTRSGSSSSRSRSTSKQVMVKFNPNMAPQTCSKGSEGAEGLRSRCPDSGSTHQGMGAFHLGVRLAGGEVAPLRPWIGDWATWAKSTICVHAASRNA